MKWLVVRFQSDTQRAMITELFKGFQSKTVVDLVSGISNLRVMDILNLFLEGHGSGEDLCIQVDVDLCRLQRMGYLSCAISILDVLFKYCCSRAAPLIEAVSRVTQCWQELWSNYKSQRTIQVPPPRPMELHAPCSPKSLIVEFVGTR